MNPTPSPFKKFLVPGLVIIILIAIGLWLFLKGGAVDQGAALFSATARTASLNKNLNAVPYPGNKGLPCLVGSTTPQIRVTSPNGGETLTPGQQIIVTWSTCNIPANQNVQVSLDELNPNGTGQGYGISPGSIGTANDGTQIFSIPSTSQWQQLLQSPMQFGTKYKIRVYLANQTASDSSDNLFTINPAGATVSVVGSPILSLYQAIDGVAAGEEDVFLAKFRFNVTANDGDVFISKDIVNIGYTRLGNGTIDAIVLDADDDSIDDGLINSYRVDAGNTEQFTLSFFVRAHDGSGKFTLNSFKYGMSDGAGSDDYTFMITPPLQTPTVYMAK